MKRPPKGGLSALGLWRDQVPLKNIKNQLQMSERTLRLILAFAKAHHMHPTIPTKPSTGRQIKINDDTIKYVSIGTEQCPKSYMARICIL